MRGGRAAVSGREGKARLLVVCTLLLQGWRGVCRARECPEGLKKIFADVPAGNLLAMFPENPRNWPVRSLMEEGEDHCVELAAGPAGTCP